MFWKQPSSSNPDKKIANPQERLNIASLGGPGSDGTIPSISLSHVVPSSSGPDMISFMNQSRIDSDWNPSQSLSASLQTVLFVTDSYDSNISVYEKGPRYSFGFVTLSGRGGRIALNLRYKPSDRLQLSLKSGSLLYLDRNEIGSSQQRIGSWHKEDINVQFTWKF